MNRIKFIKLGIIVFFISFLISCCGGSSNADMEICVGCTYLTDENDPFDRDTILILEILEDHVKYEEISGDTKGYTSSKSKRRFRYDMEEIISGGTESEEYEEEEDDYYDGYDDEE